jgi:hypothetical protein
MDIKGQYSNQLLHVAGVLKRAAQQAPKSDATLYLKTAQALQGRAALIRQAPPAKTAPAPGTGGKIDLVV